MKIRIELDIDNAASFRYATQEVARILRDLADKIARQGPMEVGRMTLLDCHANEVGSYLATD